MRKIIACVLMITWLLICFTWSSAASSACNIELSSYQNVDGYIDVTVSVKSNPGIASFLFKVYFDNKKLSPYSVMRGAILPVSGTFSNNLSGTDLSKLTYVQTYFVNSSPSFSNITADGVLYTIRFKIKDGAYGRVVFYLDDNCEVINQNENDVSYTSNTERFPITQSPIEIMFTVADISVLNGMWNGSVNGLIMETSDAVSHVEENNAIVLAAYDSTGKLIHTMTATVKALSQSMAQGTTDIPFMINDIEFSSSESQVIELKLFLWHSIGQVQPLAEQDVRIITAPKRGVQ